MKLRRKDHDDIKAYLVNYINDLWNKDKDFVEVYGKDYPKKQLEHNLRELKFNKSTPLQIVGEYDLISRNIYLYNAKNPILTLHDLIRNPEVNDLMEILLHELLHANFSRNLDIEQDENKLMTGLEIYDDVEGRVINSPLNEGFTEYLRNKLDKKGRNSYNQYARIFYLLEKRIGRKAVIALGKGDVLQNLAKAFNMTEDEFMIFCRVIEKKFIKERKFEVLEAEYKKFCKKYPYTSTNNDESKKAIIEFDKSVHKSLYGKSIMDILPTEVVQSITLEDFHDFMKFKIKGLQKQNKVFYEELYNTARKAFNPKDKSVLSKLNGRVFGFIKIYNPDKREAELRLEYYEPLPTLPENGKNSEDKDNNITPKQKPISRHEAFVSSIRSDTIVVRKITGKKSTSSNSKYNFSKYKDYDIDL